MKIKKGDIVLIIKGKDRGKTGKITSVDPTNNKIKVSGINIVKRHVRASRGKSGGIIESAAPIDASKVMFLCSHCNKPVRIGYKITKSGTKERICKICRSTV